jgi:hypothetical protein
LFFLFAMVKAIVPRYRYDQLMRLGWKVFLPTSRCSAVVIIAGWARDFRMAAMRIDGHDLFLRQCRGRSDLPDTGRARARLLQAFRLSADELPNSAQAKATASTQGIDADKSGSSRSVGTHLP